MALALLLIGSFGLAGQERDPPADAVLIPSAPLSVLWREGQREQKTRRNVVRKVLIGIVGLVVGAALGVFLVAPVMTGAAAGVGVATGLSAGICATVQAAQEEQLLTPEQIDQLLNRAAADMAAASGEAAPEEMAGGVEECAAVMERLRSAG